MLTDYTLKCKAYTSMVDVGWVNAALEPGALTGSRARATRARAKRKGRHEAWLEHLGSLPEEFWSWLGAVIDCDGHLGIGKSRHPNMAFGYQWQGILHVHQKDGRIVDHLKINLKAGAVYTYDSGPIFRLKFVNKLIPILNRVQKYLIIKPEQGQVLLEFLECQASRDREQMDQWRFDKYCAWHERMKALHHTYQGSELAK